MRFDIVARLLRRRERVERVDALLIALERGAAAAQAERARLREAVALSHAALGAMGNILDALAGQPARFDAVVDELDGAARRISTAGRALANACDVMTAATIAHAALPEASLAAVEERANRLFDAVRRDLAAMVSNAATGFDAAVVGTGSVAAAGLADELAPVRQAAEDHAAWLRAALGRLRGETETLIGAQQAAEAVRTLSAVTEPDRHDDETVKLTSPSPAALPLPAAKRRRRAA